MIRRFALAVLAMTATATEPVSAQVFAEPPSRVQRGGWTVDIAGQLAEPVGAFATNIDQAFGFGAAVRHHFRWFKPLGVRADVALLNYGNERKRVPVSPTLNRVLVDMTTRNNIALFSAGPEVMITRGPVRPYAHAFAGYSYFYTESSAGNDYEGGAFARSTNFSDGGLALGWGTGVSIPFAIRSAQVAIDAGARRTTNGARSYLRRGDIQDQPDGSLQFTTRTTNADFWQFHLGASVALRRR
jgi:hypothetical protein